jgi:hypothetical protein
MEQQAKYKPVEQVQTELKLIYEKYEGNISVDNDKLLAKEILSYDCDNKQKIKFLIQILRNIDRDLQNVQLQLQQTQMNLYQATHQPKGVLT